MKWDKFEAAINRLNLTQKRAAEICGYTPHSVINWRTAGRVPDAAARAITDYERGVLIARIMMDAAQLKALDERTLVQRCKDADLLPQQPLGAEFQKVLDDNLSELLTDTAKELAALDGKVG